MVFTVKVIKANDKSKSLFYSTFYYFPQISTNVKILR